MFRYDCRKRKFLWQPNMFSVFAIKYIELMLLSRLCYKFLDLTYISTLLIISVFSINWKHWKHYKPSFLFYTDDTGNFILMFFWVKMCKNLICVWKFRVHRCYLIIDFKILYTLIRVDVWYILIVLIWCLK